jgi:hypothetical protein
MASRIAGRHGPEAFFVVDDAVVEELRAHAMTRLRILALLLLTVVFFHSTSGAQPAEPGASPGKERMWAAVTSMAQMCERMMHMEMQNRPLKVAAFLVLGGLLGVALVLFVVLEVQAIRFLHYRIRNERRPPIQS